MKEKKPAYDEAYLDDYRQLFARGLADRFYVSCEYVARDGMGARYRVFVVDPTTEPWPQIMSLRPPVERLRKELHWRDRSGSFYVGGCGFNRPLHLVDAMRRKLYPDRSDPAHKVKLRVEDL